MSFTFIDLFAGIGGFHGALHALGGEAVYASEIDSAAIKVYENNWKLNAASDITEVANDKIMVVQKHDILTGGFPCQPFSKSGKQLGMDETRGTLFWNIAKIIEVQKPAVVLLENVRNLAGPKHINTTWVTIIRTLRSLGYRVSSTPLVVSPHKIHPNFGGTPQVRERIFIGATYVGIGTEAANTEPSQLDLSPVMNGWDPQKWDLKKHLPLEKAGTASNKHLSLSPTEETWVDAWNDFVLQCRTKDIDLPGFPMWSDFWKPKSKTRISSDTPGWKRNFIEKNIEFYAQNEKMLSKWLEKWDVASFPPSRRKFEWQAQDSKTLWECIMHLRPSGIRAKKATYVPALVAITQTSIYGPQRRKLSVRECARLQGLPDWFDFSGQPESASYKQLGNGVNLPVVYHVLRALVERDKEFIAKKKPQLVSSILEAPIRPTVLPI
jgi:DNA (cytosine-5)-methyltransferase 1